MKAHKVGVGIIAEGWRKDTPILSDQKTTENSLGGKKKREKNKSALDRKRNIRARTSIPHAVHGVVRGTQIIFRQLTNASSANKDCDRFLVKHCLYGSKSRMKSVRISRI